jgi:hypothetical protein
VPTALSTVPRYFALGPITTPRVRPSQPPPNLVQLGPEEEARLRAALAESERDEGRALAPEELRDWGETGGWPES